MMIYKKKPFYDLHTTCQWVYLYVGPGGGGGTALGVTVIQITGRADARFPAISWFWVRTCPGT